MVWTPGVGWYAHGTIFGGIGTFIFSCGTGGTVSLSTAGNPAGICFLFNAGITTFDCDPLVIEWTVFPPDFGTCFWHFAGVTSVKITNPASPPHQLRRESDVERAARLIAENPPTNPVPLGRGGCGGCPEINRS